MAVVGRAIRWLIVLALIAIAVLWPLVVTGSSSAGQVDDPVTFSEYRADFHVDGDGNLDATETITAEFPSGRHGLFRYWDVANPNSPRVRQKPAITSILMDGNPSGTRCSARAAAGSGWPRSATRTATWTGHPRLRDPLHDPGVLDPGTPVPARNSPAPPVRPLTANSPSVFFWNVVAPSWNNSIDRADITVTLPADDHRCAVLGRLPGSGDACDDLTVNGTTMSVAATDLAPRTPVTVRLGRRHRRPPPRAELPWSYKWDRILGRSVGGLIWVAVPGCRRCAGVDADVPRHRRENAAVPAAVRPAGGARPGAERVHPHRSGPQERPDRHAVLSRRPRTDRDASRSATSMECPRHRRSRAMGGVDPVSVAVGGGAEGAAAPARSSRPRGRVTAGKGSAKAKTTDMAGRCRSGRSTRA